MILIKSQLSEVKNGDNYSPFIEKETDIGCYTLTHLTSSRQWILIQDPSPLIYFAFCYLLQTLLNGNFIMY